MKKSIPFGLVLYIALNFVSSIVIFASFTTPTVNLLVFKVATRWIAYALLLSTWVVAATLLIGAAGNRKVIAQRSTAIDWHLEEVRGIFVLGIIATLLTLRDSHLIASDPTGILSAVIQWITVYWGVYIFLMALAIPKNDWFDDRIQFWSFLIGRLLFFVGALVMPGIAMSFVLISLLSGLPSSVYPFVAGTVTSAIMVCIGWVFSPHSASRSNAPVSTDKKATKMKAATLRKAKA